MRCDFNYLTLQADVIEFQSTHLHEVWHARYPHFISVNWFQSTHLHEVWLLRGYRARDYADVSIHTPTWGVTVFTQAFNATAMFQSTHLHEVWLSCSIVFQYWSTVSIHTPTWGVTISSFVWLLYHMFQSTHLHEVWHLNFIVMEKQVLFQSTHLHEVWLTVSGWNSCLVCFNPHTYMRCDI